MGRPRTPCRRTRAVVASIALAALLAGCGDSAVEGRGNGDSASADVSAAGVEAALRAAEEYLASREYANAQTILETLLEKKPDIVPAWEVLGQVRFSRAAKAVAEGRADDAASYRIGAYSAYSKAVELDPDSAGLQHSAGMVALGAGFDDEALDHFAVAGSLDPDNVQHPLYEAQVLLKQGKLSEAELTLERARAIDAEEPFTISSLAVVAMERENFERAIALIKEAREVDPRSLDFRVQEARIRRRAGQARDAINLLQPLPPGHRAEQGVAAELAACYESIGDDERAAGTWAHRFERMPADWRAALNAAEAFMRAGKSAEASVFHREAQRIAPNEPEVRDFGERFPTPGDS